MESIWGKIGESSLYLKVTLNKESLLGVARNLRKDFLTKTAISESRRNGIVSQIFQEYELKEAQKASIREYVANIDSTSLHKYSSVIGRNIIIGEVSWKRQEAVPTIRKVIKQLRALFGTAADNFDDRAKNAVLSAAKNSRMSDSDLEHVWNQLDDKGRTNLLSLLSVDLSMQSLNFIDETVFSKASLMKSVRENISQNVSPEIQELLENSDGIDINSILQDLEWADISDAKLDGKHIIGLMKGANSPFPRRLTDRFQDWLENNTKVENLEREQRQNAAKKKAPETGTLESVTPEWVTEFKHKLHARTGGICARMELMLTPGFLNGTEKLICSVILSNNTVTYLQIETGKNERNTQEGNSELYIVPLNPDHTPNYRQRKTCLVRDFMGLFNQSAFLNFDTKEHFYKNIGKVVPADTVPVEEIKKSEINSSVKGNLPAEENLNPNVDPAGLDTNGTNFNDPKVQEELKNITATVETSITPPKNLADFKSRVAELLKIEKLGEKFGISTCFSIGKPGSKKYVIYRIQSLGETSLKVWGGTNERAAEEISYSDLFEGISIEKNQFKFLENKLDNHNDLLSIMQSHSTQSDAWKKVEIIKDNDGNEIFDFIDRRSDSSRVKKQYFPGNEGHIIEIVSIQNGVVRGRIGEKFDKGKDGWAAEWGPEEVLQLHFVTAYLVQHSCVPWNEPSREILSKELPKGAETTDGTLKHIFGRLSVHDIISGMNKFTETFKHHLQHGNHLQEQRVMLGIAKRIGMDNWNSEWYADYKSQYENGEKGLIEERMKKLSEMATPLRHKTIRASVLNNGTHDYDHWTNALSMMEKHGHLYAGGLQDLEGSWIFFKRIANIPLNADVNQYEAFQQAVEDNRKRGIDNITEEAVIEAYMQKGHHFPNAKIWLMVKNAVRTGNDSEFTAGGNEIEQFNNLDQRINYVMGKLKSREYANAIGALEKIFDKEGSAWKKQSVAFLLVMSRIPERLPRSLLEKISGMYDRGRLHSPALNFIKDRTSQEKFRDTIKAIVAIKKERLKSSENAEAGEKMQDRFDEMMKSIRINADQLKNSDHSAPLGFSTDMFEKVDAFWKKYGKEIQMELTLNTQGNIMIAESQYKDYPALKEYSKAHEQNLSDTNISNDTEVSFGTTVMEGDAGSGVISSKPSKMLDKMGIQGHHGGFST